MTALPERRWRPIHLALLFVPAAAVAFVTWQGRAVREDPAAVLHALRVSAGPWLPSAAAAGARSATPPERYERERLHELVDGAAERYLEHGVERCAAATYAFPGAAGLEIAAEVYRFRDGAGAQAQAEAERTSAEAPVQELPGTSTDGQVLHAVAGRQLLKLTVLSPDPGGRERLLALAAAWRKDLP